MTAAVATLQRYRSTILIDAGLLLTLYLLPAISHTLAFPLYKFEPMRVALIIALLFTSRANTYLIAFTIPLASALLTGHPEFFKAVLMGIELSSLVAVFSYLIRLNRIPSMAALMAAIVLSKVLYYCLKSVALSLGVMSGQLVSTPVQSQFTLAVGTAVIFGLIDYYRTSKS